MDLILNYHIMLKFKKELVKKDIKLLLILIMFQQTISKSFL